MGNSAIVGINWGDEGKGRMVDLLTDRYDVVVRYQGGGNAGHTVVNESGKFALHLLPSGIFRKNVVNILGNGVALDPESLWKEIEDVTSKGVSITPENLKISDRASLLLPWHRELDALEEACARQGAVHKAVIMADLGDLREGFWDQDEMLDVCVHVERDLPHVELAGVGVNLGCYGSIQPTPENLGQLVAIARRVEAAIGRKLEIVSGGATSSFTLVHWGTMPEGINHLRIGEGIFVAKDLQVDWGIHDMDYLRMDCMTLRAQIVEVKDKPTHPVGPIMVDCFCSRPTYEDRGIRRRAIAGIGRADVGDIMMLHPRTPGMTVVGGSSDHCILDVEDCDPCPQVGDIVDFDVIYLTMLYASAREDVAVKFVD